jgi:hypothetical protein
MLQGDMRLTVRYLTNREKGGILRPNNIDEKTGDLVQAVLRSKHQDARIPKPESLPIYAQTLDFVKVNITADAIKRVAQWLSGSAGLGCTDCHALKHWLLIFRVASVKLCKALGNLTDWLSNGFPPWVGYRAFMSGWLCTLDKCTGVHPVGLGETCRYATAKIFLLVACAETKEACRIDQLCLCWS